MAYRFLNVALVTLSPLMAQAAVLSGKVSDSADGSPLPYAVVRVDALNVGTVTDPDGRYSIKIPDDQPLSVCCEYVGFVSQCVTVTAHGDRVQNFVLSSDDTLIDEVRVTSHSTRDLLSKPQMGVAHVDVADLVKMPAMMGEQDVIKSLTLMPGVQSESDASGGFQVRGGESSQNLVMLDGVTINNAGHLLGFFSPFNSDLLREVTLYKGSLPVQFGGRCSSVLDITTVNGDMDRYRLDGSVGILASKLCAQGPLVKDKASFVVSARRTYLDLFLKFREDMKDTKLFFYDMNAKLSFRLSENDFLTTSFFRSTDVMNADDIMDIHWGNTSGSARWSHQFASGIGDCTTTAFFTRYMTSMGMDIKDSGQSDEDAESTSLSMDYGGRADQSCLNYDLRLLPADSHTAHIGFQLSHHDVVSVEWSQGSLHEKEERYGLEWFAWAGDEWQMGERVCASAGLRYSSYSVLGGSPYYQLNADGDIVSVSNYPSRSDVVATYANWEPRAAINVKLSDSKSLKLSYSRAAQNIHTLKSGIASSPVDRMTPCTNLLGPEVTDQFSVGYAAAIASRDARHDDAVSLEVEAYYKAMDGVLDYREGFGPFNYAEIDRVLLDGIGRSYGLEFSAKKNHGRLTGWLSYTLSKTETKIDGLNSGRWYLSNADRRHAVRIVALYSPDKRWDFSAAWVFNSGQAMSLPVAKYKVNNSTAYYYDNKNNYRTPNYHRLDVSATLHLPKTHAWQSEWSFGFYNLYARYNPYMITLSDDVNEPSGTRARQISLFALVPSVAYRFKF